MNPLEAPLQAVRAALAAQDAEQYHEARDAFNDATAELFRKIEIRRK